MFPCAVWLTVACCVSVVRGKRAKQLRKRKREEKEGAEGPFDYYSRSDCFKVEKNLLHFGWGRWDEIMQRAKFKRRLLTYDVITLTRAILLFSLQNYAGDEQIKGFIYDLILPRKDGQEREFKNHEGLSAPVPRGRKGKQAKLQSSSSQLDLQMAEKMDIDPETLIGDEGYKKHLKRHGNKILLRIRLLYYVKEQVIGDEAQKVFDGAQWDEVDIPRPVAEGGHGPPVFWWDEDADRSLLIGVFKHGESCSFARIPIIVFTLTCMYINVIRCVFLLGPLKICLSCATGYEKYALMRNDPCLVFMSRCGAPDPKDVAREQNDDIDEEKSVTQLFISVESGFVAFFCLGLSCFWLKICTFFLNSQIPEAHKV